VTKISAYSAITSVEPDDLLVVVDVHDTTMAATGTTKKMTLSQLPTTTALSQAAVQTANYVASAGQIVPVNTTSGDVIVHLPNAPASGTLVSVKHVIQGGTNAVSVETSGSDVFNKTGGATTETLTLVNQGILVQYQSGIWMVLADDLPLTQLDARYGQVFSPMAYGAAGNGSTDDTTAVLAAFAAAFAVNGIVDLGPHTYLTSQPIPIAGPTNGIVVRGTSAFASGTIQNATTDLFQITGSAQHMVFQNCNLYSLSGGGHIWNGATTGNVSTGPSMSFWKILGVNAQQNNAGNAVWYQVGGAFIDCLIDQQCYFSCVQAATVSPWSVLATPGNFNSVQFKRMRVLANGAMVPFFRIDPGWGMHTDTSVGFTASSPTVTDTSAVASDLGMFIYSTNLPGGIATITAVTPGTGYTISANATATLSGQTCLIGSKGWIQDIQFDSVTFEVCSGGGIAMTGSTDVVISLCANWDILGPRTDTGCGTTSGSPTVTDTAAVSGDHGKTIAGAGIPALTYITAVTPGTGYTISQNATATASGLSLVIGGQAANFYSFTKSNAGYACENIQVHGGRAGGVTAGTTFSDFYADTNSSNILIDSLGQFGTPPVITSPAAETTLSNITVSGLTPAGFTAPSLTAAGMYSGNVGSRLVGGSTSATGAPATGAYNALDIWVDSAGVPWICTAAGSPGTWVQPGGPPAVNIDWVTATGSYTWTKPSGAQAVDVIICGGGGGGGSGAVEITGNAGGGSGGGSGGMMTRSFVAADLPSSVTGSVGAGGTGGTAVTGTTASNGNAGNGGGATTFGTYCWAEPSSGGNPGTTSGGTVPAAPAPSFPPGTAGGAGGGAANGAGGANGAGTAGGGGGGGASTSAVYNGGNGGISLAGNSNNQGTGGTAGGAGPTAGTQPAVKGTPGPGAGGGGGVNTAGGTAQTGATAWYGGGGGGGGGAFYPGSGGAVTSGAGGTGGPGFALIITHFA
jgi:hypothetical protein